MGGEIWAREDRGSIGFRAKDEFGEGFVTAGHFAEFGAPVVLDSFYQEETISALKKTFFIFGLFLWKIIKNSQIFSDSALSFAI
ncbi:hypothetical protein EVA_12953 [gut metagenome]|uniref:Uncharacterized protein n=1 Tax=gut metagenome TaxID=749906 RepID=J9CFW6_9ZZZZ